MNLEDTIKRTLETCSAGFSVATLDVMLSRMHERSSGAVGEAPLARHALQRSAVRLGALGIAGYAMRSRPDALAAVAGSLGYATVNDFAIFFESGAHRAR